MKKQRLKTKDLRLIAVVSGPGAFSALRLGVTTANALAWSLGVPVVELSVDEVKNNDEMIKSINQILKYSNTQIFKPVVPKYGKEPNITKAKNN